MKKAILVFSMGCLFGVGVWAGPFTLPTLDPVQITPIMNTLASAVAFRPVAPASSVGLFGFSLGLTAIDASTNQVTSIIGTGTPALYDADISAMIQVPLGLAVEAGYLPSLSIAGVSVNRLGVGVKWTFTDIFLPGFFFDSAIRAVYTNAYLSYSQQLNGANINVAYNANITGANLGISKKFLFVEPYIGYGVLQHSSTLSGTVSLFNGNFPSNTTSVNASGSNGWFNVGVQFNLGWFRLAAEYDNMFLDDTFSARIAMGI